MSVIELASLNQIRPDVVNIPADLVLSPNMPIAIFSTECESLKETYLKDSAHFLIRKIDTAILADQLDMAVSALREAEMLWHEEATGQKEATKLWSKLKVEAFELKEEAEASLDFVIDEHDTEARNQLEAIIEGTGNSDMILDLGKLHRLAVTFATPLDEIAFTSMMIARLEELYTTLTDVYGKVSSEKGDENEGRVLRDRVFTHCGTLQKKSKKAAKLVFRGNPDMYNRYRSEYSRKHYLKKN